MLDIMSGEQIFKNKAIRQLGPNSLVSLGTYIEDYCPN